MKNLLILSDTHGDRKTLEKLKIQCCEADYIIHLGDGFKDLETLSMFQNKIISIKGNCDAPFSNDEKIIEIENVKLFLTHGHFYGVKSGKMRICDRGKELGANVILHGHNHTADISKIENITIVNPGAFESVLEKTYGYATIEKGKFFCKIVPIN